MGLDRDRVTIGFIGGGPRPIGLIERMIANQSSIAPECAFDLLIFDPHPAGPGRIWRYDQSPSLKMNSLAEDVAMFADETSQIAGPLVTGPTLAEWFALVKAGEIPFAAPDARIAEELASIGPQGFATRRLFSCYLRWYFEHVRSLTSDTISIEEITGTVLRVVESESRQFLEYIDEHGQVRTQEVDVVIYTVGHTDSEPTADEVTMSTRAASLGLSYWPANYASESNFDSIPGNIPVLVRGLGLSFIDIMVRLTLDRGGREIVDPSAPPGYRTTYIPSGREPHLFAGSRRGVPYHSKITSHLHGEQPGYVATFLTRETLTGLLNSHDDLDFDHEVWPIIVKEMAFWHYREIFTGHPERTYRSWEFVVDVFNREEFGSERFDRAMSDAVDAKDVFDINFLDRPLDGVRAESLVDLQQVLAKYIENDISVRESEKHSETLAVFLAILTCYGVIAESLGHPGWSIESRLQSIPHRWHDFFSYVDSGPPASRLELVLALMRAGLLTFVGGDIDIRLDEAKAAFIATSSHHPDQIEAHHLIEGFHPVRAIEQSTNPVLLDLIAQQQGVEQVLPGPNGSVSTRKLEIDFDRANVIRPDGTKHRRRFAIGDFTSGPPSAAFSRPKTNARIFRENDSIARHLLETIAQIEVRKSVPTLTS